MLVDADTVKDLANLNKGDKGDDKAASKQARNIAT